MSLTRFVILFLLAFLPGLAATLAADIDAAVTTAMKELQVPGVAVGVIRDGQILIAKGYGVRAIEGNQPVTANTVFAVGSITKSFTAASCATVVEEGKIDWDRPVREYWPWFRLYDPVATELITLRDLLTHRSGLPRHDFIRMSTPLARDELLRRLRYFEPSKTFRETFQYNNLMYVTAGFLCADRAGMTWEDLVRRRIFEPLGMTNSTVSVKDSQSLPDFARPHELADGKVSPTDFYDYQRFGIGPNGAVNSSVADMLKYLQFYLEGGTRQGRRVVAESQMKELHQGVTVSGDGSYALGWGVDHYRGNRRISHGGAIVGFTAHMALFPVQKAGVVVLNNLGSPLPAIIVNSVADRVLGLEPEDHLKAYLDRVSRVRAAARPKPETSPGPKPSLALVEYAGQYSHPAFGAIEVTQQGDGLSLVFSAWSSPLRHLRFDTFAITRLGGAPAQFRLGVKGNVDHLLLPLEPTVKPFVFQKK